MSLQAPSSHPTSGLGALSRTGRVAAPAGAVTVPPPRVRWLTRIALPITILLLFGGILVYAARDMLTPALDVRVIPVVVGVAETRAAGDGAGASSAPATVAVHAPGWIEPDPFAILVPALIEGVVSEVLVLEGDAVEAGQVVAKLVDEDAQIAHLGAKAMVAELMAAAARAAAAVAVAEAGIPVEQATLDALRDELERKRELVASGRVGAGEFRRLEIQIVGAEARLTQARSVVEEAKAMAAQADAASQSAHVKLAEAALMLARTQVRAPVAGVVMTRLVEPGSRLAMGAGGPSNGGEGSGMSGGIVRLYNPTKLQVRVDVPLSDAAKIGVGTSAHITTEALPNATFTGHVTRLVHEANIQRNTVQFKVAIDNPSAQLRPEMLCRVKLQGTALNSEGVSDLQAFNGTHLLIPKMALLDRTTNAAKVWIVATGTRAGRTFAATRHIEIAGEFDDYVIVRAGLKPGDRLIANAPAHLTDGAPVRIVGEFRNEDSSH